MFRLFIAFALAATVSFASTDFAQADGFGFRRGASVNARNFNVQVNRGFFGPRVAVNVGRGNFASRNFNQSGNFNFNRRAVFAPRGVSVNVNGFGSRSFVGFNNRNARFNSFGTRTVVDGFGNVFEVDAFGNAVVRGNKFGRSFFSSSNNFVFNRGFCN